DDVINKFKYVISDNIISIDIPPEIIAYLNGVNNEGDRILVRALLNSFNCLFNKAGYEKPFNHNWIQEIIEKNVPFGLKKKIFIIDSEKDLRLDPRFLPRHRYVQNHEINIVLDIIIPK